MNVALLALSFLVQQDAEAVKAKLMDQVRERLKTERTAILERIGKLIDEELAKSGPLAGTIEGQIDLRVKELEQQLAEAQSGLREMKLWKADIDLIKALPEEGPKTDADVRRIFTASFKALSETKEYEKGNRGFKILYYALSSNQNPGMANEATVAAYNTACGYSLMGKENAEASLDWLEISLKRGYATRAQGCTNGCQYDKEPHSSFEHMEIDPDFENVRDTERWKALVRQFKP